MHATIHASRHAPALALQRGLACLLLLAAMLCPPALPAVHASEAGEPAPLVVGNRTLHVFRDSEGLFSAAERAQAARRRIEQALANPGEGWTSVTTTAQGAQVELDGRPMFPVLPGDAQGVEGHTAGELANEASRALRKAWLESREKQDPRAHLEALLKLVLATALAVMVLLVTFKGSFLARMRLSDVLTKRLRGLQTTHKRCPTPSCWPT